MKVFQRNLGCPKPLILPTLIRIEGFPNFLPQYRKYNELLREKRIILEFLVPFQINNHNTTNCGGNQDWWVWHHILWCQPECLSLSVHFVVVTLIYEFGTTFCGVKGYKFDATICGAIRIFMLTPWYVVSLQQFFFDTAKRIFNPINLILSFFDWLWSCGVAVLMKNYHQLSLTFFLVYSSLDWNIWYWCQRWNSYFLAVMQSQPYNRVCQWYEM